MSTLLPPLFSGFVATVALAFLFGLELHAYRRRNSGDPAQMEVGFGTTRTLTLLAAFGFALWVVAPVTPFCVGLAVVGLYLAQDYRKRLETGDSSLLPALVALLAYALGPVVLTASLPVVAVLAVVVLLSLGEQSAIRRFSDAFPAEEGVTLAKFLILAGLIFPLLPPSDIPFLPGISYTKVWMAVLVISGISYLGYLAHRYVFPQAGTVLTGVLGGLYSSTAATVVLARSARTSPDTAALAPAAIVIATAMMYARLLVLITLLGHPQAALSLALPFGALFTASVVVAGALAWHGRGVESPSHTAVAANPLDLPVAFLFAALFVVFAAITNAVTATFGAQGLHLLSFAVGFSDIDPFIFSLLAGHFAVSAHDVVSAILIASASNNLLKALYTMVLSRSRALLPAAAWLLTSMVATLAWALA